MYLEFIVPICSIQIGRLSETDYYQGAHSRSCRSPYACRSSLLS